MRWTLGLLGLVAALAVAAVIVLTHWDWNRHRPWINAKVSEATGRHFAINGDLSVKWHWPQPLEAGWRRWIPGVTIQAQQLTLDNPPGFTVAEEPARGDKELPALPRKPPAATAPQQAMARMSAASQPAAAASSPAYSASADV